jgi:RNA polymerase sigma factor (sigma-70 family)
MALRQRFEALLSEGIYTAAWRFAYRLSPSREDAEDLLQEALVLAFARLGQLRDPSLFKPWLFAIIRRRALRQFAQDRQREQRESAFACETGSQMQLRGVEAQSFELGAAIAALPPEQREIILLHYLDGLNLAQSGLALGCSERAAKQRLYRARQSLRRLLAGSTAQADFSALL